MEAYSDTMREALAQKLRHASPQELEQLRDYYGRRGGPGLTLVRTEQEARNETPTAVIRHLTPAR